MKNQNARPTFLRSALTPVFIFLLYFASPQDICAQATAPRPRPAPTGASTRSAPAPAGIAEREMVLRELEKEAARPPDAVEGPALPLERIAADFRRMQIVNNRMLATVIPSDEPDYRLISESSEEIRKCAARLKSNLSLPEPEPAEGEGRTYRSPADAAQMKAALLLLDGALMRFVKNPVFKQTDVVDTKKGALARRDLDRIIELSRLIGKDAERMAKGKR